MRPRAVTALGPGDKTRRSRVLVYEYGEDNDLEQSPSRNWFDDTSGRKEETEEVVETVLKERVDEMETMEKECHSAVVGREPKSSICVVNVLNVDCSNFELELGCFEDHRRFGYGAWRWAPL